MIGYGAFDLFLFFCCWKRVSLRYTFLASRPVKLAKERLERNNAMQFCLPVIIPSTITALFQWPAQQRLMFQFFQVVIAPFTFQ
jgi:hypothetical protein